MFSDIHRCPSRQAFLNFQTFPEGGASSRTVESGVKPPHSKTLPSSPKNRPRLAD
jgi:hypothetical protein